MPSFIIVDNLNLRLFILGGNKTKRNIAVVGGVVCSIIMSPFLAGLAVSIGVPILLCYVYGVVPIALCRSEGTYYNLQTI